MMLLYRVLMVTLATSALYAAEQPQPDQQNVTNVKKLKKVSADLSILRQQLAQIEKERDELTEQLDHNLQKLEKAVEDGKCRCNDKNS